MKTCVIFIAPSIGDCGNGPHTYASYLLDAFRNDAKIEFVPCALNEAIRLKIFRRMAAVIPMVGNYFARRAMQPTISKYEGFCMVHMNDPHSLVGISNRRSKVLCQINDYETMDVARDWWKVLRHQGFRRVLTLAIRYYSQGVNIRSGCIAICNSNYTARRLSEEYPSLARVNIRVITKSVDVEFFRRSVRDFTGPANRGRRPLVILFVGNNLWLKGFDIVLEAMQQLRAAVVLRVVGATPKSVRRFVDKNPLPENIRIETLGRVDRVGMRSTFWNSDLLLAPSRSEAFGVTALEAIASGLPVISTRVGGVPEALSEFEGCLLIEPNSEELLNALERVLNGTQVLEVTQRDLNRIGRFDIAVAIDALRRLYEEQFATAYEKAAVWR